MRNYIHSLVLITKGFTSQLWILFFGEKIWYVDRLEQSWSEVIKLDSPINNGIIFYQNEEQKQIIIQKKEALAKKLDKRIAAEIMPLKKNLGW